MGLKRVVATSLAVPAGGLAWRSPEPVRSPPLQPSGSGVWIVFVSENNGRELHDLNLSQF